MPVPPRIGDADGLAVFPLVGNAGDLRVSRKLEIGQHMDRQLTEAFGKRDMVIRRDVLVADDNDAVVQQRPVQGRGLCVVILPRQIRADDFRAQHIRQPVYL